MARPDGFLASSPTVRLRLSPRGLQDTPEPAHMLGHACWGSSRLMILCLIRFDIRQTIWSPRYTCTGIHGQSVQTVSFPYTQTIRCFKVPSMLYVIRILRRAFGWLRQGGARRTAASKNDEFCTVRSHRMHCHSPRVGGKRGSTHGFCMMGGSSACPRKERGRRSAPADPLRRPCFPPTPWIAIVHMWEVLHVPVVSRIDKVTINEICTRAAPHKRWRVYLQYLRLIIIHIHLYKQMRLQRDYVRGGHGDEAIRCFFPRIATYGTSLMQHKSTIENALKMTLWGTLAVAPDPFFTPPRAGGPSRGNLVEKGSGGGRVLVPPPSPGRSFSKVFL